MKKISRFLNLFYVRVFKNRAFAALKSCQKAFSLLELLIALSITGLLWGCAGFLIVSLQSKLRDVMHSDKINKLVSVNLQFQNDIHSAVKITGLTPNRLAFELPEGRGAYEYRSGFLYREFKGLQVKSLENISENQWECFSEGSGNDVDLNKCQTVFWSFTADGDAHTAYAVKKVT